ncbi:MAG: HesB/IscA family protein [Alphaproteobacteria bacterium]
MSSVNTAQSPAPADAIAGAQPSFHVTEAAAKRIAAIAAADGKAPLFRISVDGGGCSGFQYKFDLADAAAPDDLIYRRDGVEVLIDAVSIDFVKNAQLDYVENLMGSFFQVSNPNAKSSCGCGTSFSVD